MAIERIDTFEIPPQRLLDYLTRVDELLIENLKVLKGLQLSLPTARVPAPIAGIDLVAERQMVESGQWRPYDIYRIGDMGTAVTDKELVYEGDFIACWTNGSYAHIGVRLNHPSNPIFYFDEVNPIKLSGRGKFWKLYLTYDSMSGKSLSLFIGRQTAIEGIFPYVGTRVSETFTTINSDKDTHFTGAIAQNAIEEENIAGLVANKIKIVGLSIQSDQQLDYRVIFFGKDTFADADLDVDAFTSEQELDLPSYGWRIAGAGQYYMVVNGLSIDYEDQDGTQELHVALQNLSVTAKGAGATGEVVLRFTYEERA